MLNIEYVSDRNHNICFYRILKKCRPMGGIFLAPEEGCSLWLQQWGPSGPTVGPFGTIQNFAFCILIFAFCIVYCAFAFCIVHCAFAFCSLHCSFAFYIFHIAFEFYILNFALCFCILHFEFYIHIQIKK